MKYLLMIIGLSFAMTACNQNGVGTGVDGSASGGQKLSSAHVNLAWGATTGSQQGFYIEQSSDGVNFTQVMSVPDGTTSASVSVATNSTYYFRIRSYNGSSVSAYTPVVTARL